MTDLPASFRLACVVFLMIACGDDGGDSSGGDAGPECVGEATSCLEIPADACEAQMGCSSANGCFQDGLRPDCDALSPEDDCLEAVDCRLMMSSDGPSCFGASRRTCGEIEEARCRDEPGCAFGDFCQGEAVGCSDLTDTRCAQQIGCSLNR